MINDNRNLWEKFKTSFRTNIENLNKIDLERLRILRDRKYFFKNLFPKIADDLGFFYKDDEEFLRVDYTFFKKGHLHNWIIPQIFIESENSWDSSYQEALKLCSLNAPLKVLILYDLTKELQDEIDGNYTHWDYIFKDFINESRLIGLFAILVYKRDVSGGIDFHYMVYAEDGTTIDKGLISVNK